MKLFKAFASVGLAGCVGIGVAQSSTRATGWEPGSAFNQLYTQSKEVTVSGKIAKVSSNSSPLNAMGPGTEIAIATRTGRIDAELGPSWFIKNIRAPMKVGGTVKVTGAEVQINGRNVILARKIWRGNRVLYLRDLSGFPMWVAVHPVYNASASQTVTQNANVGNGTNNPDVGDSPFGPVALSVIPNNSPPASSQQGGNGNAATPVPQVIQGTVQNVMTYTNPQTGEQESYVVVNTPQGPVNVDLGPQWYIGQQPVNFSNGTHILVNGILAPGEAVKWGPNIGPTYLANGVSVNNQIMIVRNGANAIWSPWFPSP